ncbi:unnamed protein product [Sphagnum tenellum]
MERLDDDFMQLQTKDLVLSWCSCCSSLGAAARDIMAGADAFRAGGVWKELVLGKEGGKGTAGSVME